MFESELDDNGISKLTVKQRVMHSCFFLLSRFWMRLDGVCARVYDTRIFHAIGSDHLVVECSMKSLDYATLLEKCGKPAGDKSFNDVNNFIWALEEKEMFSRTIMLSSTPKQEGDKTEL